jgi:hypothetical protein
MKLVTIPFDEIKSLDGGVEYTICRFILAFVCANTVYCFIQNSESKMMNSRNE